MQHVKGAVESLQSQAGRSAWWHPDNLLKYFTRVSETAEMPLKGHMDSVKNRFVADPDAVRVNLINGPVYEEHGRRVTFTAESSEVMMPMVFGGPAAYAAMKRYNLTAGLPHEPVEQNFGTPEKPVLIPSFEGRRIVLCNGPSENPHEPLFFNLSAGAVERCTECGQCFRINNPEVTLHLLPFNIPTPILKPALDLWHTMRATVDPEDEMPEPRAVLEYREGLVKLYNESGLMQKLARIEELKEYTEMDREAFFDQYGVNRDELAKKVYHDVDTMKLEHNIAAILSCIKNPKHREEASKVLDQVHAAAEESHRLVRDSVGDQFDQDKWYLNSFYELDKNKTINGLMNEAALETTQEIDEYNRQVYMDNSKSRFDLRPSEFLGVMQDVFSPSVMEQLTLLADKGELWNAQMNGLRRDSDDNVFPQFGSADYQEKLVKRYEELVFKDPNFKKLKEIHSKFDGVPNAGPAVLGAVMQTFSVNQLGEMLTAISYLTPEATKIVVDAMKVKYSELLRDDPQLAEFMKGKLLK